jgi:dual specificity tyrosine-phosphorylation-regulated kinase 2/3/4
MEIKGKPPLSVLAAASRRKNFFDDNYHPILEPNSQGKVRNPGDKDLNEVMKCEDELFVDFVNR